MIVTRVSGQKGGNCNNNVCEAFIFLKMSFFYYQSGALLDQEIFRALAGIVLFTSVYFCHSYPYSNCTLYTSSPTYSVQTGSTKQGHSLTTVLIHVTGTTSLLHSCQGQKLTSGCVVLHGLNLHGESERWLLPIP